MGRMDNFAKIWPALGLSILIGFDIWIWFFPMPEAWERKAFMSGCLTSVGYSDIAQERCYADFTRRQAIRARGYLPPSAASKERDRAE